MFSIGFDTELTQFGVENPTSNISSFNLANEEKFNLLHELMIQGYKEFKAHPIVKKIMYADISHVLEGGKNEGDKLLLRFHNKRIVKYVSFQLFNGETGDKTSGRPIFSKFIGLLPILGIFFIITNAKAHFTNQTRKRKKFAKTIEIASKYRFGRDSDGCKWMWMGGQLRHSMGIQWRRL